jgi:hypothetical protein
LAFMPASWVPQSAPSTPSEMGSTMSRFIQIMMYCVCIADSCASLKACRGGGGGQGRGRH